MRPDAERDDRRTGATGRRGAGTQRHGHAVRRGAGPDAPPARRTGPVPGAEIEHPHLSTASKRLHRPPRPWSRARACAARESAARVPVPSSRASTRRQPRSCSVGDARDQTGLGYLDDGLDGEPGAQWTASEQVRTERLSRRASRSDLQSTSRMCSRDASASLERGDACIRGGRLARSASVPSLWARSHSVLALTIAAVLAASGSQWRLRAAPAARPVRAERTRSPAELRVASNQPQPPTPALRSRPDTSERTPRRQARTRPRRRPRPRVAPGLPAHGRHASANRRAPSQAQLSQEPQSRIPAPRQPEPQEARGGPFSP